MNLISNHHFHYRKDEEQLQKRRRKRSQPERALGTAVGTDTGLHPLLCR